MVNNLNDKDLIKSVLNYAAALRVAIDDLVEFGGVHVPASWMTFILTIESECREGLRKVESKNIRQLDIVDEIKKGA